MILVIYTHRLIKKAGEKVFGENGMEGVNEVGIKWGWCTPGGEDPSGPAVFPQTFPPSAEGKRGLSTQFAVINPAAVSLKSRGYMLFYFIVSYVDQKIYAAAR